MRSLTADTMLGGELFMINLKVKSRINHFLSLLIYPVLFVVFVASYVWISSQTRPLSSVGIDGALYFQFIEAPLTCYFLSLLSLPQAVLCLLLGTAIFLTLNSLVQMRKSERLSAHISVFVLIFLPPLLCLTGACDCSID